ncbi:MAG: exonuclease domain-containing protein [Acidimicrobiia bacterium]
MTATPLQPGRYAVLDFETTALEPGPLGRVLEIGVVELRAVANPFGSLDFTRVETWETLVRPGGGVGVGPTEIHGIQPANIIAAPRFDDVAGDLLSRLDRAVVVAHNAQFDLGFLASECAFAGIDLPPLAAVCTRDLARGIAAEAREEPGSFRLAACCERAGIDFPEATQHRSLGDVEVTAQLFVHLMARADALGLTIRTTTPPAALEFPPPSGKQAARAPLPTRLELPFDVSDSFGR